MICCGLCILISFCLLYHANQIMFFCVYPTTLALNQSKVTVDSPSTKVISQEEPAVSALDTAGNNTVVMAQSDKNEDGTLVVCIPITFCLLYHANLIMFFVYTQRQ
jgi:hypothetical protein